jgi:hypothetical protein
MRKRSAILKSGRSIADKSPNQSFPAAFVSIADSRICSNFMTYA